MSDAELIEIGAFASAEQSEPARDGLTLPFDLRQRSRLRAHLDSGREAAVIVPRGHVLRGGDRLVAADGSIVEVKAAAEPVSSVYSSDAEKLARCAYHLGNRHVALEVGKGYVRYLRDHVLDDMVRGLHGEVQHEDAPFEPEAGAYGGHGHSHGDSTHSHGEGEHAHSHGAAGAGAGVRRYAFKHGHGHGHGQR